MTIHDKLNYLMNGMNSNWKTTLLWTGNISSAYGGGTITLDLSEYNNILIYSSHLQNQEPSYGSLIPVDGINHYCGASQPDGVRCSTRKITVNSNGVTFATQGCSDNTYHAQYCIPVYIYGVNISN